MELLNDVTPEIETKVHPLSLWDDSKFAPVLYSSVNKLECIWNITLVLNACFVTLYYTSYIQIPIFVRLFLKIFFFPIEYQ